MFLAFVCSCDTDLTSDYTDEEFNTIGTFSSSHYVPYEEALDIANSFLDNGSSGKTRSTSGRKVREHGMYTSNSQGGDAISFHIINYDNDEGFAIVSADDRTTSVYAFSDTGNFNIADTTFNKGLAIFLEGAVASCRDEIAQAAVDESTLSAPAPLLDQRVPLPPDGIDLVLFSDGTTYGLKTTTSMMTTENLLSTHWRQSSPYNYYCPVTNNAKKIYDGHSPAGCVAIAIAQIMAYHQYPSSYNGVNFNWDYILYSDTYALYTAETDEHARETAKFIYQVGLAAGMSYARKGSSSNITKAKSAFGKMGYTTSAVTTYNSSYVYSSIKAGCPVYMRGTDDSGEGHAWVIDGAQVTTTTSEYYEPVYPYTYLFTKTTSSVDYFHCNWGWGGLDDGYYNTSTYKFGNNNQILYNIYH